MDEAKEAEANEGEESEVTLEAGVGMIAREEVVDRGWEANSDVNRAGEEEAKEATKEGRKEKEEEGEEEVVEEERGRKENELKKDRK